MKELGNSCGGHQLGSLAGGGDDRDNNSRWFLDGGNLEGKAGMSLVTTPERTLAADYVGWVGRFPSAIKPCMREVLAWGTTSLLFGREGLFNWKLTI